MEPTPFSEKTLTRTLLDVLIRAGLIAVLVLFCFEIFSPFRDLMLWSLILAITLYPLQARLKGPLGQRDGRIATLIILSRHRHPGVADLLSGHLDCRLGRTCDGNRQGRRLPHSTARRISRQLAAGGPATV